MPSTVGIAEREGPLQLGRCPECGSREIVTDRESGEVVCSKCGLVIREEMLDQKPEWRAFTSDEMSARTRTGSPSSLTQFDKGLSTSFQTSKDAHGRFLPMNDRLHMMRLRKCDIRSRIQSSNERNLLQAMSELTLLSDKLRIPKYVEENAALIYRKVLEERLVRGRSIKGIAAASLYAACRLTRTPRSLRAMVEVSNGSRKEISRYYRLIQRELEMKLPVDDSVKYVSKIASKVGLSQRTQNLAIELLQNARKVRVDAGKGPTGMAAATLYIASIINGENVTQKNLAEAAEVTEVTIRNRYKGLAKALGIELKKVKFLRE